MPHRKQMVKRPKGRKGTGSKEGYPTLQQCNRRRIIWYIDHYEICRLKHWQPHFTATTARTVREARSYAPVKRKRRKTHLTRVFLRRRRHLISKFGLWRTISCRIKKRWAQESAKVCLPPFTLKRCIRSCSVNSTSSCCRKMRLSILNPADLVMVNISNYSASTLLFCFFLLVNHMIVWKYQFYKKMSSFDRCTNVSSSAYKLHACRLLVTGRKEELIFCIM